MIALRLLRLARGACMRASALLDRVEAALCDAANAHECIVCRAPVRNGALCRRCAVTIAHGACA